MPSPESQLEATVNQLTPEQQTTLKAMLRGAPAPTSDPPKKVLEQREQTNLLKPGRQERGPDPQEFPRQPSIGRIILLSFADRPEPIPAIVTKVMPSGWSVNCTAFVDGPVTTHRYESVGHRYPREKRDSGSLRIPTWHWHDDV